MLNLLLDIHYLIPRLIIWALLFGLALTDAVRHRHVKRRGHQLQRGVLLVIGAFIVQDVLLLAYSAQSSTDSTPARNIYLAYIFFTDFADSSFHVSLLLRPSPFALANLSICQCELGRAALIMPDHACTHAGSASCNCSRLLVSLLFFL